MHQNSIELFRQFAVSYFERERPSSVLEISPGSNPSIYCNVVNDRTIRWETLGLTDDARFTIKNSKPYSFPVEADTFDALVSGQVIEHVPRVWEWFKECVRVVKPGGLIFCVSPISWPFHPDPYDCWRIYPDGLKALCEYSNAEVLESQFGNFSGPEFRKYIGGRAWEMLGWKRQLLNRLIALMGGNPEVAVDMITIARKRTAQAN